MMACPSSNAARCGWSYSTPTAGCSYSTPVTCAIPVSGPGGSCPAAASSPETYHDAAVRELREETGIIAARSQVGPPAWRRLASFRYRRERRLQHEVIVTVRLPAQRPDIDETLRLDYEKEDYFGYRWWPVQEVLGGSERFYPGKLPALLGAFLDGHDIDEPFELWS
jgi:8-oxo-dGTP pyrophosphatase MutT (NUDIX family)